MAVQRITVSETGKLTAALSAFLGAVMAAPNEDLVAAQTLVARLIDGACLYY